MYPDDSRTPDTSESVVAPTHAATVRAEVEPFRTMTPAERLAWFVRLQKSMDAFVRMRPDAAESRDPADREFWRHWRDPAYGRPR